MDSLNEHCILEIMAFLTISEILSFGSTNMRNLGIVSNYLDRVHARGIIEYVLQFHHSAIREILQRFGRHFFHLTVQFGQQLIDMDIFQDYDGVLINNTHRLILMAYMDEPNQELVEITHEYTGEYIRREFEDYINEEQVKRNFNQIIDVFRRNATNIIRSINCNDMPILRNLTFVFELRLSVPSYFTLRESTLLSNTIHQLIIELFSLLRRGNVVYDIVYINHQLQIILHFDM